MADLDWDSLHFGPLTTEDIKRCIPQKEWQEYREALKGKTLEEKYHALKVWLRDHTTSCAKVQVTNYVNALKRGGQI